MQSNLPSPQLSDQQVVSLLQKYPQIAELAFSIIFVTYNRCPNKDFMLNPLTWAFLTLINGSYSQTIEFLVVVDGSTDYTLENLDWLRSKYKLNIKVISRNFRKGCSFSRREGIDAISNNIFFLVDDDCLYKKDFILGGLIAYIELQSRDENLACINLPMIEDYQVDFVRDEHIEKIGRTDFKNAWFYHNFDCYPTEYRTTQNIYFDDTKTILKPFQVDTFKVPTINNRDAILKSGNFLDLSVWANDYSEHLELAHNVINHGYTIYHLPDARIACTHLKYGSSKDRLDPSLKNIKYQSIPYSLEEIRVMSNQAFSQTGCRVDNETFLKVKIGSFLSFYLKANLDYAMTFALMEYKNYVEDKNSFTGDAELENRTKDQRYALWDSSIKRGLEITEQQMSQKLDSFYDKLISSINLNI